MPQRLKKTEIHDRSFYRLIIISIINLTVLATQESTYYSANQVTKATTQLNLYENRMVM